MKSSQDGFAFVADCFGKGMFREEKEVPVVSKEQVEEEIDEDEIPMQKLELYCVCDKENNHFHSLLFLQVLTNECRTEDVST